MGDNFRISFGHGPRPEHIVDAVKEFLEDLDQESRDKIEGMELNTITFFAQPDGQSMMMLGTYSEDEPDPNEFGMSKFAKEIDNLFEEDNGPDPSLN